MRGTFHLVAAVALLAAPAPLFLVAAGILIAAVVVAVIAAVLEGLRS